MTQRAMHATVRNELAYYPRGPRGSVQNEFRMVYALYRLQSLGRHAKIANSAAAARQAAVSFIRRDHPNFDPETVV